ncbi:sulfotransferase [Candidatus Poribacteria bacterium]|nr:sulfotransferase [Candidatus Poribacteria bacterium]
MRPKKALTRLLSYSLFEGRPATTKVRWLNPIIMANLRRISENNKQYKTVEKPIFILGTGRSGTTILGVVLSIHQDIGYLNEPKAIWHLIHPQEDVIGSYTNSDSLYKLSSNDSSIEMKERAKQLFGAYLSTTGSHRVVDKYPELIFRVEFVRELFPDARFILLIRNGWDTCHSIAKWSEQFGVEIRGESHNWWGVNNRKWHLMVDQLVATNDRLSRFVEEIRNFDRHLDKASIEWIVTMQQGIEIKKKYPENILKVTFEELTSNPIRMLTEISNFCELPYDKKLIEYGESTLHPIPTRDTFQLDPVVKPIFYDIMRELGYNS